MKALKCCILFILSILVLAGCTANADKATGNSYTQINQETAKKMMESDDGHVVVDVRRQDEHNCLFSKGTGKLESHDHE